MNSGSPCMPIIIGAALSGSQTWPLPQVKHTTPDNGKPNLIDWHDPEKILKAEQKRIRKAFKRLRDRGVK